MQLLKQYAVSKVCFLFSKLGQACYLKQNVFIAVKFYYRGTVVVISFEHIFENNLATHKFFSCTDYKTYGVSFEANVTTEDVPSNSEIQSAVRLACIK